MTKQLHNTEQKLTTIGFITTCFSYSILPLPAFIVSLIMGIMLIVKGKIITGTLILLVSSTLFILGLVTRLNEI